MFRARHEKAANVLKAADDVVDLVLAYNPEEYNRFEAKVYELRQQLIRSTSRLTLRTTKKKTLFVRALFDYDPSKDKDLPARGLAFCYGDILHVTNASDDEWWQARRIVPGSDDGLGIIPSKNRIERKEKTRLKNVKFLSREADGKGSLERKKKSLFGRRLSLTRSSEKSKSLDGLSQEPVSNLEEPILTYEVVVQQELQYVRPLVLVGLLKEAISGDLILEYPDLFANCLPHTTRPKRDYEVDGQDYHFVASRQQMEEDIERGLFIEAGQYNGNLYGTSLASILRVASEDKHCILDVSPNAIKRLQMNGLYPITILVKPATISTIQAWNRRLNEGEARKVYENNLKLEQSYADYLTAIVIGDQAEEVYASVKDVIWNQSSSYIWVPADPFS
ncbi:hypothetical protein HELRODRAFT_208518 [Helobdella robusta]|uniref:Guanylate kinase-like domain-containing protein n=1 Tax=Helobdella robusta TaxID=6412 RepID=T1ED42_HELRO|nr:hypothetical protein HELRODRAFT_208518 [Helobdella robusta]ESN99882.1 hypothetical protein HELRODRAFT_208518 [Helobdella robusta]